MWILKIYFEHYDLGCVYCKCESVVWTPAWHWGQLSHCLQKPSQASWCLDFVTFCCLSLHATAVPVLEQQKRTYNDSRWKPVTKGKLQSILTFHWTEYMSCLKCDVTTVKSFYCTVWEKSKPKLKTLDNTEHLPSCLNFSLGGLLKIPMESWRVTLTMTMYNLKSFYCTVLKKIQKLS